MDHTVHNKLVSFIWRIADDCLRDVYVRGKYRDVILPMTVLRRIDSLLEGSKEAVLEEVKFQRETMGTAELEPDGLRHASGYVFYNTSPFTLKRLAQTATNNNQRLETDVQAYLNGFSDNVVEIVDKFNLRAQVKHMAGKDVLLEVLEKFTDPYINLTPNEKEDPDGRAIPPLSNLGMGYVFEELIRKFNEENNEEAGEHFTPREVIRLMTRLIFDPLEGDFPPTMFLYDPACGSGGMLTESKNYLVDPNGPFQMRPSAITLYGKEVNDETYAICKSDMMIKGDNPEHIRVGSTLATDEFAGTRFDVMLSNPPYGKSWSGDQKYIVDGKNVLDGRFQVKLRNYDGEEKNEAATPRSSDGQLLFLMEMASKMKPLSQSKYGTRIASVHNGSSLFTGDAGGGESNIRRHLIENDWLEAIIQLPNNLFYNTGITTYIWLLSNNKQPERRGKVQLIDASELYRKLRKNLGAKNCELSPEHIDQIMGQYLTLAGGSDSAKLFDNADFGYYKVTVERPLRQKAQFNGEQIAPLRLIKGLEEVMAWGYEQFGDRLPAALGEHGEALLTYAEEELELTLKSGQKRKLLDRKSWEAAADLWESAVTLTAAIGDEIHEDVNQLSQRIDEAAAQAPFTEERGKLSAGDKKKILAAVSWSDPGGAKVIKKRHKLSGKKLAALRADLDCTEEALPDHGYWPSGEDGVYLEYETDSDLRDTENVPLKEGVHGYFLREVRPHVADAWLDVGKTKIGYEVSFNKYFYRHTPLRSLGEVTQEILALETETEGLLKRLVSFEVGGE